MHPAKLFANLYFEILGWKEFVLKMVCLYHIMNRVFYAGKQRLGSPLRKLPLRLIWYHVVVTLCCWKKIKYLFDMLQHIFCLYLLMIHRKEHRTIAIVFYNVMFMYSFAISMFQFYNLFIVCNLDFYTKTSVLSKREIWYSLYNREKILLVDTEIRETDAWMQNEISLINTYVLQI